MHVNLRVRGGERSERARQELDDGRNIREHAHVAVRAARMPMHFVFELGRLMQQHPGAGQQRMSRRRQFDAFGAAHQQGGPEIVFQVGNALTDGGGNRMRAIRGARDAARLGYGHEQFQVSQVETHECSSAARAVAAPRQA